jgi:hypothetical protein
MTGMSSSSEEMSQEWWVEPTPPPALLDAGDFHIRGIVSKVYSPAGSKLRDDFPASKSPYRYLTGWLGYTSDEDTYQCQEDFYWDRHGECPDILEFEKRCESEASRLDQFSKKQTQASTSVVKLLVHQIKKNHKGATTGLALQFRSARRVAEASCDRPRFDMLIAHVHPEFATKVSATKCAPPPILPFVLGSLPRLVRGKVFARE